MTTPTISAALTPDDMPPAPLSEDDLRQQWNKQADEYNQWESLDSWEQLAWAQALAIRADRHAAAPKAKPEGQRPTDEDLYDLAAEFNGDPVPAMRRALELWGNPLQGAPEPGENPAAAPAPAPETPAEALAVRPLLERVAQLGEAIGRQTVAQVQQLANQAAVWLRENPPGQLVAIEPRGCPTPGACSCVEPTSPSPAAPPALVPPALVPVAWCRSDEFANSMNRGGSFNGWKDPGAGANKCDMQLYAIPLPRPATPSAPEPGDVGELVAWIHKEASHGSDADEWRRVPTLPQQQDAELAVSERRPEGNWVDSLQHAVESKENDFLAGVCVSLAVVTAHGEATVWREIVRSVGTESLLNYVANVNPEDWEQAGFSKYAQAELGKGKPLPAPQAGDVEA